MLKKILSVGALLAISLVPSSAATVSFSDTVNTTFTPNTLSFSISQFDGTLGTLTGILIEFSATLDGDFTAFNQSNSNGTLTGTMSGTFTLEPPAPLAMPLLTLTPVGNLGPQAINAGDTVAFSVFGVSASDSYSTASAAEFVPFVGPGTVAFGGTAVGLASPVANFTPLLFSADIMGEATVTVTYEFEEAGIPDVPEPMTMYMMGGGLLALGFIRRSRSSRKSS